MKATLGAIAFLTAAALFSRMAEADEFVVIAAGDFQVNRIAFVGGQWIQVTNTVYISAFEMARYPVTKPLWDEVRDWARTNGYSGLPEGKAKEPNHPVRIDKWYHAVLWCNARSEKEGLPPVYYNGPDFATVYKNQDAAISNACVRWGSNGYRLPTEAEFYKAFRGGLEYSRFPWGDEIAHSNANYFSTNTISYDISPTRGYHPDFITGTNTPFTSPVGHFAPNGYGLYDMSGNTRQFLWDRARYGTTHPTYWDYWGNPPRHDPKGLDIGDVQFAGGGHWNENADKCSVFTPYSRSVSHDFDGGIRPVRSLPPEIRNPVAGDSGFRFDVAGRWELGLTIQSRTNLVAGDWDDILSTNIQAGSQSVPFVDPGAQAEPRRFYRVVLNDRPQGGDVGVTDAGHADAAVAGAPAPPPVAGGLDNLSAVKLSQAEGGAGDSLPVVARGRVRAAAHLSLSVKGPLWQRVERESGRANLRAARKTEGPETRPANPIP